MQTRTLIIGGGLSGLALADALNRGNDDFLLVEARNRLGGRILSENHQGVGFDMGPAWFWPGQPRIHSLVSRFGLVRFEQFAAGDLLFEDQNGVQRGQGFASMEGSNRIAGGLGALVDAFEEQLPKDRIVKNAPVERLVLQGDQIFAYTANTVFTAQRVVLALPPRIAAEIGYEPALPQGTLAAMKNVATWMAGQAKVVAIYESPFWRDAGLSGDVMSRIGPMVEMHDASPMHGAPYALFGFIGVPPHARQNEDVLRRHLIAQLGRLFGSVGEKPSNLMIKDWAFDPFTSTEADLAPLAVHPQYGLPALLAELWNGALIFAGSEVAQEFGGYLEGALEAAETAHAQLIAR